MVFPPFTASRLPCCDALLVIFFPSAPLIPRLALPTTPFALERTPVRCISRAVCVFPGSCVRRAPRVPPCPVCPSLSSSAAVYSAASCPVCPCHEVCVRTVQYSTSAAPPATESPGWRGVSWGQSPVLRPAIGAPALRRDGISGAQPPHRPPRMCPGCVAMRRRGEHLGCTRCAWICHAPARRRSPPGRLANRASRDPDRNTARGGASWSAAPHKRARRGGVVAAVVGDRPAAGLSQLARLVTSGQRRQRYTGRVRSGVRPAAAQSCPRLHRED